MVENTSQVMISIDGGPEAPGLIVSEQEMIEVRSKTATKPDLGWTFVDAAGHFHAYSTADSKLPTLVARDRLVPCNGACEPACEGYTVTDYYCSLCDAEVEPGRVPDELSIVPGMQDWHAEIQAEVPRDRTVSIRATDANGWTHFGFARAVRTTIGDEGQGIRITTRLASAGPLGRMKPARFSVAAG